VIVALLIVGTLASTVLAQSTEQVIKDRRQIFVGWLGIINNAETKYKSKHGVYGNLTALRHAHLLDALVFEPNAPSQGPPDSNRIPTSTGFQVTVSSDGQHYKVAIRERLVDVGNIGLFADEASTEWMVGRPTQVPRDREDGPEGPMPSVAR
jgi:type II secretory pathway pseudopilin PulG